jgi:hypothetical protein
MAAARNTPPTGGVRGAQPRPRAYRRRMPEQLSLFEVRPDRVPVVLSYGMGVDSTALLLRWLHEPESRDFELDDLAVLTAMTGDEFADTERLVTTHILHRLREHRVRFVQVARTGAVEADGITVLGDSRGPAQLHMRGPYRLSDELLSVGTVPQVAHGQRRCTHHFKGFPLTAWTRREYGDNPIRRVIGYNADEQARADRAEGYSTDDQPYEFPLISWEWGRERCEGYVRALIGETWRKSCCVFCPFTQGKADVLARYRESPCEAAEALFLEYVSLCMNPAMTLYGSRSLRSVLERDCNRDALRLLEERLAGCAWAVYRVRRIVWAKGRADRKTERLREGGRAEVTAELLRRGAVDECGVIRGRVRERGQTYPNVEEMVVAAPAVVADKSRPSFEENWRRLTAPGLWDAGEH